MRKHTSRDYDFSKLAWMAQRREGAGALAVLQDALMEKYGSQFEAAIRQAKARRRAKGVRTVVIFSPTMERAYRKHPHQCEWYTQKRWPFSITTNPHKFRSTAIVVWDSAGSSGFRSHHWTDRRQRVISDKQEKIRRRNLSSVSW